MTDSIASISRRYQSTLRAHLKAGPRSSLKPARGLGGRALAAGLETLGLARLHEETLLNEVQGRISAVRRAALIRQAAMFFAEAVTPPDDVHRSPHSDSAQLGGFVKALSRRTVELATSNRDLNREIALRKTVEEALKKSERHYAQLLLQSDRMQKELRRLSRQVLSAQEEERKRISRELHDVIAQTLTGINIRLAALKKEASINTQGLDQNIERTRTLVEQSVDIVHRFARELRPAVLDDLGLIPALQSFLMQFRIRTGLRVSFAADAEVESLNAAQRTVLFRVAQEALINAERHARARRVAVTIRKDGDQICMTIADDGKSFQTRRVTVSRGSRGLGLLCMRERLEMVGGNLEIKSQSGTGTTVVACMPVAGKRPQKKAVSE